MQGVGAYRTEELQPYVLDVVKKVGRGFCMAVKLLTNQQTPRCVCRTLQSCRLYNSCHCHYVITSRNTPGVQVLGGFSSVT